MRAGAASLAANCTCTIFAHFGSFHKVPQLELVHCGCKSTEDRSHASLPLLTM